MTKRPVGLTKILGVLVDELRRDDLLDDERRITASLSVLCFTLGACCVETTIASLRTGTSFSYSIVTWRLAVGAEEVDLLRLADLGELARELVRVADRRGHELGRLVAREAEHQALVAGALLLEEPFALGHALRDVGRLLLDRGEHRARLAVEAHRRVGVADLLDRLPHDDGHVDRSRSS